MLKPDNKTMMCSFCGKTGPEVFKLICGPGVCICDSCINTCKGILDKGFPESTGTEPQPPSEPFPVAYRVFKVSSGPQDTVLEQARAFASTLSPSLFLSITETGGSEPAIVVWYREPHRRATAFKQHIAE